MTPIISILGSWSSGTTAVTGYLARLGAYSCPPHVMTRDERTPDSFEARAYRDQLAATHNELTLKKIGSHEAFRDWYGTWTAQRWQEAKADRKSSLVLKHPLSAFLIDELVRFENTKFVVVTRPFEDIERTRQRRKWHPTYGGAGARSVYGTLFSKLIHNSVSYHAISFRDFLQDPHSREMLRSYLGDHLDLSGIDEAEKWIRK